MKVLPPVNYRKIGKVQNLKSFHSQGELSEKPISYPQKVPRVIRKLLGGKLGGGKESRRKPEILAMSEKSTLSSLDGADDVGERNG